MALCHITGTVQLPDGTSAVGRVLVFKRNPETVVAQSGHGIIPDEVAVRVAADGTVDFKLYTANYIGFLRNQRAGKERVFGFPVPESATANFQDILQAVDPVEPLPSWLTEAFEARDEAEAAETAAQEAAGRAEANAALVKPQFDSVAALQADTAMTDATVPVGTVVWTPEGPYVRVISSGDIVNAVGLNFDVDTSSGFLRASMLSPSMSVVSRINAAFQKCKGTNVSVDASGFGEVEASESLVLVRGVSAKFDGTVLKYGTAFGGASAAEYDVSGLKRPTTVDGLTMFGPDYGGEWSSTLVDGLDFSQATSSRTLTEITFNSLHIEGFRHARVYGSNVYINSFKSSYFLRNYSSFYCPDGMSNVGEKTLDIDCLIGENQWADIVYSAVDRDLIGCSVDYQRIGDFDYSNDNSGRMKMQGGNYEFGTSWVVGPRIKTPANELQGAQRSGFIEFSRVRMQVRDPSAWPSGIPLAVGAGDVVFTKSHIWGVGNGDEPLMTGGGRVERDRCTYSRVPTQSWDSGRALNANGGFEVDTPLVDIGFWVEGGGNTSPSVATNLTISRSADMPRTGSYSAKITPLFGSGSSKEVWFSIPISWGELPFSRYYIRPTVTPSGNLFTDMYYAVGLGFDSSGVPKFGQKTSIGTQSFIPASGSWSKRIFSLSTPENLTAPKWATHVLVRISMNAVSSVDGPIYIDDWHFDVASGRKR